MMMASSSTGKSTTLGRALPSLTPTTRHVILPVTYAKYIPRDRLMSEAEWRKLGVAQSPGWVHYAYHKPEPHILLFRRAMDA